MIRKTSCFYVQLIPSPRNATSLWKACILQILYATFLYFILHVLRAGTDLQFELHRVWFSEGSAVLLIEREIYMLELEHRSFSHSLVEGDLVIQAVHIRKNRALKTKNKANQTKKTHMLVQQLFCGVQITYLKMENINTTLSRLAW